LARDVCKTKLAYSVRLSQKLWNLATRLVSHFAASYLNQGKNVLYITMEMAEEKISERIDANLMNINLDDIEKMPKDVFDKKLAKIKSQTMIYEQKKKTKF
jgi:KaiC/GvpD/RAD55 family RecA-like ATPase